MRCVAGCDNRQNMLTTNTIEDAARAAYEHAAGIVRRLGPDEDWRDAPLKAFESLHLAYSRWEEWLEAWCYAEDAAHELGCFRPDFYRGPLPPQCSCTCGHYDVDHHGAVCVHEHCDCTRYRVARRKATPRALPQTFAKPWDGSSRGIDRRLAHAF